MSDRIWTATHAWLDRRTRGGARVGDPDLVEEPATGVVAIAEVNHGRWIAPCPFCPGAQMVCLSDPRFFCADCRNMACGHRYLLIELPATAELVAIERALLERPRAENRNWRPGETVEQLDAELAAQQVAPALERLDIDPAVLGLAGALIGGRA